MSLKQIFRDAWVVQMVGHPPLAQVMISRSWDRAPCWGPSSVGSLLLPLSLFLLVRALSLAFKWIKKMLKKIKHIYTRATRALYKSWMERCGKLRAEMTAKESRLFRQALGQPTINKLRQYYFHSYLFRCSKSYPSIAFCRI